MDAATQALMFSSKDLTWETPTSIFQPLDDEFHFDLDAAASAENKKVPTYLGEADNALTWQEWPGDVAWLNPPYGRGLGAWIAKATQQAALGKTVVVLMPARTDTKYFHAYIWDAKKQRPRKGVEVRFLQGRVKFGSSSTGIAGAPAPFPSMIVIFRGKQVAK